MVGNIRDARLAVKGELALINPDHGANRLVYRKGSVVYKIDREGEEGSNEREIIKHAEVSKKRMPKGVRLPALSSYRAYGKIVVAMEYVDGDETGECYCLRKCHCQYKVMPDKVLLALKKLGLDDMSYQNVRLSDGFYVPIDFDY